MNSKKTRVLTPEFRAGYPNVYKARLNALNGKDEYSLMAIFGKDVDLTAMRDAAKAAAEQKWGTDPSKIPKLRSPFRDQGEKRKNGVLPPEYEDGAIFCNFKSHRAPGIVDQEVQHVNDEARVYAGVYLRATVNAYAYDSKGNRGVSFGLENIQIVRDGEPLGNSRNPENDFEPVQDHTPSDGDDGGGAAAPRTPVDLFS